MLPRILRHNNVRRFIRIPWFDPEPTSWMITMEILDSFATSCGCHFFLAIKDCRGRCLAETDLMIN